MPSFSQSTRFKTLHSRSYSSAISTALLANLLGVSSFGGAPTSSLASSTPEQIGSTFEMKLLALSGIPIKSSSSGDF